MNVTASHIQWLDDPEQPAADRMRPACWVIDTSRHRDPSDAIVRRVLGLQAGVSAEAIELTTGAFGRRVLSPQTIRAIPQAAQLDFSVSHCPGTLLVGVFFGGRIGVDVETEAPIGWEAAAANCLTESEQQWLGSQAPADAPFAFLRLWTAKEAIAKALGLGVQADFAGIELQPRGGHLHVMRVQHSESLAAGWLLDSRDPRPPAGRGVATVATIR